MSNLPDKIEVPNQQGTWKNGRLITPTSYSETRWPELQDARTGYTIEDILLEQFSINNEDNDIIMNFTQDNPAMFSMLFDEVLNTIITTFDLTLKEQ